ncbi:methyltransferase family protein [Paraburkholderia sp. RAU2J]|uniref:class I SAM-dependent methyltransferase n=1 Tax=Paraburkholderia sp. RAU2J TaxID=1938810 RepID=UPI000EAE2EBB|nr:methyltransferase domain-containing protein [Paraburkholderia sp. RAU2J]RKT21714.1 methyltransferase family protein [Paraburkholderia sp. RAU2J]
MLYHLDTCSIFHGILVVEGWSEYGAPHVLCKDTRLVSTAMPVPRPDVVEKYGEGAAKWGFKVCTALPPSVRSQDIALLFGGTEIVPSPGASLVAEENHRFNTMTQTLLKQSRPGDRVLEIGSRARSGNSHRHLVHPDVDYVGIDISTGPGVDVVGDAHHLSRHVTGQFDTIFSISVFEHLLMPWMVAIEMNKMLKLGGIAYIQSHPSWPLHYEPWDFWRFSKDAWEGLFNAHTGFEMLDKGHTLRSWIVPECTALPHLEPGLDRGRTYLCSACLVRKIGPAKVQWNAEAGEVYNLAYNHR